MITVSLILLVSGKVTVGSCLGTDLYFDPIPTILCSIPTLLKRCLNRKGMFKYQCYIFPQTSRRDVSNTSKKCKESKALSERPTKHFAA